MSKRTAFAVLLWMLAVASAGAEDLQITVEGGGRLTVTAAAEQQQWIVLQDGTILVAAVVEGRLVVERFAWEITPVPGPEPGPEELRNASIPFAELPKIERP